MPFHSILDADDFEPQVPKGPSTDKWDGEDDEDVKVFFPLSHPLAAEQQKL